MSATWWRRTGATLPWGDALPSHQSMMEGYFWRFTDVHRKRVVVVACGVNHHPERPWGTVIMAASPLAFVRSTTLDGPWADSLQYRVLAPPALRFEHDRLSVSLTDARLEATVVPTRRRRTVLPAAGLFSLLPGLNHYWYPYLFDARVDGSVKLGDQHWDLSGCEVYVEKSWGRGFPPAWWWGQAHGFDRPDVGIAFAGGRLGRGHTTASVSGLVISLGAQRISFFPPTALVRGEGQDDHWHLTARSPRYHAEITGQPADSPLLRLPIPSLTPHQLGHSNQHLAGTLTLRMLRDGKVLYAGSSALASLETGQAPDTTGLAQPAS